MTKMGASKKERTEFSKHCENEEAKHKAREATALVAVALGLNGEDIITPEDLKQAINEQTARNTAEFVQAPARTGDQIVYTLQNALHEGHGKIEEARFVPAELPSPEGPHEKLVPLVVNVEEARVRALMKLDGLDLLVLGLL